MTSAAKFTPGPWTVEQTELSCGDVCTVYGDNDKRLADYLSIEDAHLISAAPDLFAAIEAAIECGIVPKSSAKEGGANAHVRQLHVADMLRAALAKACGLKGGEKR